MHVDACVACQHATAKNQFNFLMRIYACLHVALEHATCMHQKIVDAQRFKIIKKPNSCMCLFWGYFFCNFFIGILVNLALEKCSKNHPGIEVFFG